MLSTVISISFDKSILTDARNVRPYARNYILFVSNRLADWVFLVVGSSRSVGTSPNSVRQFRPNL